MVSLGKRPLEYIFELYDCLRNEDDYYVMSIFFEQMEYLRMLFFEDKKILPLLEVFLIKI